MLLATMVATLYATSWSTDSASNSRFTPLVPAARGSADREQSARLILAPQTIREGTTSTYEDEISDDETLQDPESQTAIDRPRKRTTDSLLSSIGSLHCHNVVHEQMRKKKDELWLRNQLKIMSMLQDISNKLRQQAIIMPHTAPPPEPQPTKLDEHLDLDDIGAHDAQDVIDRIREEPHHCQLGTVAAFSAWLIGRQSFWLICQAWAYKQTNMVCGFEHDTDNAAGFWEFYKELTLTPFGMRAFSVFGAETPEIDAINLRYFNATDHAYRDCWNTSYEINLTQGITTSILNVMALIALWIWLTAFFTRVWDVRMLPN